MFIQSILRKYIITIYAIKIFCKISSNNNNNDTDNNNNNNTNNNNNNNNNKHSLTRETAAVLKENVSSKARGRKTF